MEMMVKEVDARDVVYAIQNDFNKYFDSVVCLDNIKKLVGNLLIVPNIDDAGDVSSKLPFTAIFRLENRVYGIDFNTLDNFSLVVVEDTDPEDVFYLFDNQYYLENSITMLSRVNKL